MYLYSLYSWCEPAFNLANLDQTISKLTNIALKKITEKISHSLPQMGPILPEKVDCSLYVVQIFIHSELVNLFCSLEMVETRQTAMKPGLAISTLQKNTVL